jgi:hypothetical protein
MAGNGGKLISPLPLWHNQAQVTTTFHLMPIGIPKFTRGKSHGDEKNEIAITTCHQIRSKLRSFRKPDLSISLLVFGRNSTTAG